MTKARTIANLGTGFVNISDSGTEGTKVASGTTAQRGSTTGQWRFNSTTGFFEGRGASEFNTLEPTPTISSVDDGEVDSASGGNQTIVITGTGFTSGAIASFVGSSASFNASTTTVNSSTQITAVAPKSSFLNAQEPYKVKITSATGIAGTSATGLINVDNAPTWNTTAGALGNVYENISANHFTLSATDPEGDTVTYTETGATNLSGAGFSLNSSTGVISGDPTDVSGDTTVSFTARATAGSKTTDRAFNIIVKNQIGVSGNPATSAKQLYDAGITTDGIYYMNNIWTNNTEKQCYIRFNTRDGVHWQRWTPDWLTSSGAGSASTAYSEHGGGASSTTFWYPTNTNDYDVTSKVLDNSSNYDFKYESYNSGAGVSWIINPRLQLSNLQGFYYGVELICSGTGDNNNRGSVGFDYQSSDDGTGNWSHDYHPELMLLEVGQDATFSSGVRNFSAIKFTANGSNTTYSRFDTAIGGNIGKNGTQDELWSRYANTSNAGQTHNDGGVWDYTGDIASSDYWALRIRGWSDNGNAMLFSGIHWIGIK